MCRRELLDLMPEYETQRPRAIPPILGTKEAVVDEQGTAVIPEGTREIFDMAFQGNLQLVRVVLPDSVRKVGARAFAQCENLREVRLNDGLESLEGGVFNGCIHLEELVLPDSLCQVNGYALCHTGFRVPVYNQSRTILYHYPENAPETVFAVPQGVKRLGHGAFLACSGLEKVILPEGLEVIEREAFVNTSIRSITIPASVRAVEGFAFWGCQNLEQAELLCGVQAVSNCAFYRCPGVQLRQQGQALPFLQQLRLQGVDLLGVPRKLEVPGSNFWKEQAFTARAARCAQGDPGAMMEFAEYLESLGTHPFFLCAANFWWYRSGLYGDPDAIRWVKQWMAQHPHQMIPSVMKSSIVGIVDGLRLRALGFLFFDPQRSYCLYTPDGDRIVQVCSPCGWDGPDEDGFGREELYDWWYLDEHLTQLPGVEMLHAYSDHEACVGWGKRFEAQHAAAVRAVRAREQKQPPTGRDSL